MRLGGGELSLEAVTCIQGSEGVSEVVKGVADDGNVVRVIEIGDQGGGGRK